ncbi:hypothetical protein F5Y16DRAFT_396747 [Xylariaceae sp. FL0255]|nr:hypothetical protein F5Y16DRAFT_396747 [Xylariaceae sp. FL0255]
MPSVNVLPSISGNLLDHGAQKAEYAFPEGPACQCDNVHHGQPPLGFPSSLQGPMAWNAGSSFDPIVLTSEDVKEVDTALQDFLQLELHGDEVARENFVLPKLGQRLGECAERLHRGQGVSIIRGLDPSRYSEEDNVIIFLGLASYIGGQRGVQNSKRDMLTHIYESSTWTVPREKRHGIHTNASLPFHSDMGCEILAIHIRSCAAQGGGIFVASSAAVYNALMNANPWAVHTLAKHNWPVQVPKRGTPFVLGPLIGFESGKLIMSADPSRIGPHPATANGRIPDLMPAQHEALALLQHTATKLQVRLPTQKGDIVFVNNWAVLHARDAYQDDAASTRHLVRLWLRNEHLAWDIPISMRAPWESSFGAQAPKINRNYPVVPMPEYMAPKFSNGSAAFVVDESDEGEDAREL